MIYLDSAATSLLKPPEVLRAVTEAMESCASPGRGAHEPAMRPADTALDCREEAAAFFHMDRPENVVFTHNATHGLNIAIRSLVRPGMRVVISGYEHNAVRRPLLAMGARIDVAAAPLFDPAAMLAAFRRRLPGAGAAVCTHVSNVFGYILPIEELAALCRRYRVPLIVDAAQSAGVLDLDMPALEAAFIAMPGHKGLLGPQGTGLLLCRDTAAPLMYGGTGSRSRDAGMPPELPDRLEAGTLNIPGIAGLLAGLRYIRCRGLDDIRRREEELRDTLLSALEGAESLRVYAGDGKLQTGVVSAVPLSGDCESMSERLAREGVALRTGLHCAPLAHETAGTVAMGTMRFSLSPFNTREELEHLGRILKKF